MYPSIFKSYSTYRTFKVIKNGIHSFQTKIIKYYVFSDELQKEFSKKDDEECVTLFANLTEISRNLESFCGNNLVNYLKETIHHWHNVLKEKLAK